MQKKRVVVIAGPTGSGETTFTHELLSTYPNFTKLVTATTRPPRPGEREGFDYYFMSKEEFFDHVQDGSIPEYTHVVNRDAWYGTYRPELEKKIGEGRTVVVNTDLKGARWYKEQYGATTIFIKPKSLDLLRGRITRRDPTITEEEVNNRMVQALKEINEAENQYDYVVWNNDGGFVDTISAFIEILKKENYDV